MIAAVLPGLERLERLANRIHWRVGSLRAHLIFWNVLALSVLLGGLALVCRAVMFTLLMQSVDRELMRGIEMYRRPPPFPTPSEHWPRHPPNHSSNANDLYFVHFYDRQGRNVLADERRATWDAAALERVQHGETAFTTVSVNGGPVRILSSVGYTPLGRLGLVQKGYSLKEIQRAMTDVDIALLLLIPVGLSGAGWLGAALTDRVLQRVHRMTCAAAEASEADFARRLPVSGSDEFAEMAETFNGLLGRLDRAFQAQRQALQFQQRFIADASHELKTPLTIVCGHASLALNRTTTDVKSRRAFQEIAMAAATMSELVEDLLLLARSDEERLGESAAILSIFEILERARAQVLRGNAAPIALMIADAPLCLRGNAAELTRLFRNLLDNAVRYTPPTGRITVMARVENGAIIVTVADTGIGIAQEHLPHLGERFYRVDSSRTRPTGGTGLGLSICRSIVEAHHGAIRFDSALHMGTTVTVILPNASHDI